MFDIPQTTALPQLRSLSLGPTRSAPVLVFGAYRSRLLDRPIAVAGDPQQFDSAGDQVLAGKVADLIDDQILIVAQAVHGDVAVGTSALNLIERARRRRRKR